MVMLQISLYSRTAYITMIQISEYDVTFAVKEWLLRHGWDVIAFNPPGAQGTFTIPNPAKDPKYRGQTGSESPDIIAIKNGNSILLVESKPRYNQSDVDKLVKYSKNKERINLMIQLVEEVCRANAVPFKKPCKLLLAIAYGLGHNSSKKVQSFQVSVKKAWNSNKINPLIDPYEFMTVVLLSTESYIANLIRGKKH